MEVIEGSYQRIEEARRKTSDRGELKERRENAFTLTRRSSCLVHRATSCIGVTLYTLRAHPIGHDCTRVVLAPLASHSRLARY
jgi:hypothetical protein